MPVAKCSRDYGSGGETFECDERFINKHTRRYIVLTDSQYDTGFAVATGASIVGPDPIPLRYTRHPTDLNSYARRAKVERAEDPHKWFITVEWDNQVDTTRNQENPLDRPPLVRLRFAQFQKPIVKDSDGKLICTTAGQPIIPAVEIDESRPVITVERNEASFPAATAVEYQDAISTDTFYGADPGCAKMQNIDVGEERLENGVRFRVVTYEIHFDRDGWEQPIINRGTQVWEILPPETVAKLVPLPAGHAPVLLNEDGGLLNGSGFCKTKDGSDAVYLTIPRYKKKAFGALNLEYSLLPIA